jgi:phosphatidylinositol glycan class M
MNRIAKLLTDYPFLIGLSIRIFIAWFLPLLLDEAGILPGVAYTDIDYHVFTDAAEYVRNGESPFQRHTYRYTPFLALILSKVNGRYLFCVADALCGKLILQLQQAQHQQGAKRKSPTLLACCMWMYNPLAINICTRGSAESFVVLLPVLLTVAVAKSHSLSTYTRALLAGILHGISVHAKVYPIIYSLSFMAYFGRSTGSGGTSTPKIKSFVQFMTTWIRLLLQPAPLIFAVTFVLTFCGLTYAAVYYYGRVALDEGLLYHLSRVDHRHNYSMWWYPIYLAKRQTPGIILLVPQAILLFVTSLGFVDDLGFTLFCQTYLFVTLNKVITAQYFTWYLCLLPLCQLVFSVKLGRAIAFVVTSVVFWLGSAYLLELQGLPVHRLVWIASVIYFCANINLLRALIQSHAAGSKEKSKER